MSKIRPTTIPAIPAAWLARIRELRQDLHAHPELAYQEVRTSQRVEQELQALGISYQKGLAGGTGLLAHLRGARPGPCIALRADMDALPIQETTGLFYASTRPGCMHACGHDGHTAILLGVAALLKPLMSDMAGSIKLLFQPAEEGGRGAGRMIADGVLEDPPVEAIFALHGWPYLPLGHISTRPGTMLAAVDAFRLTIVGQGGHGASPHLAVDPIVCGAAMVQSLQTLVSRETDPTDSLVVTVGQFQAGSSFNIIPASATLVGTIRTLQPGQSDSVRQAFERVVCHLAAAHRCQVTVHFEPPTPPTFNAPGLARLVRQVAQEAELPYEPMARPVLWGEDFALYQQHVPGCFIALGLCPPQQSSYPMLHTPAFDFNDAALVPGIRIMAGMALGCLAEPELIKQAASPSDEEH